MISFTSCEHTTPGPDGGQPDLAAPSGHPGEGCGAAHPFGLGGWFGLLLLFWSCFGLGALDEWVLLGRAGIGWLAVVFGSSQTGSPPTVAWPSPGGSANHSSLGAFSVSRAAPMKACQAGAAVSMASLP